MLCIRHLTDPALFSSATSDKRRDLTIGACKSKSWEVIQSVELQFGLYIPFDETQLLKLFESLSSEKEKLFGSSEPPAKQNSTEAAWIKTLTSQKNIYTSPPGLRKLSEIMEPGKEMPWTNPTPRIRKARKVRIQENGSDAEGPFLIASFWSNRHGRRRPRLPLGVSENYRSHPRLNSLVLKLWITPELVSLLK
ncbi:hypothetical protein H6P81_016919 [Aristolochia fimbriata]|uniref:Uncharacterized protein n=1 Tax=Aristolochia fimbriata TaxID=158543 RepID=A0AAV7DWM3_ARIFI|nr:hypothetical protein H6P81_016919 [Aristolochia fimbriata]